MIFVMQFCKRIIIILVNLLCYLSRTSHNVDVNETMPFTDGYKYFIKILHKEKRYTAPVNILMHEFPNKKLKYPWFRPSNQESKNTASGVSLKRGSAVCGSVM